MKKLLKFVQIKKYKKFKKIIINKWQKYRNLTALQK
jgi:hypothetical protein